MSDLQVFFSHSMSYLFTLLIAPFEATKCLILVKFNLFFSFVVYSFVVVKRDDYLIQGYKNLHILLTFRSITHFELLFVYGVR